MEQLKSMKHNRRTFLGICNGIFDPIRISSPFSIKLKILMKDTLNVDNPGNWDSPVSTALMDKWASAVSEAFLEGSLNIHQIKPSTQCGKNCNG